MRLGRPAGAAIAVAWVLAAGAVSAQPARYEIDPEHLSVGFMVEHAGYAQVLGMFLKGGGSFEFDEKTATLSNVRIVIDAASVFTNHRRRDDHLRSADFLNSAEFPRIVFTAESARQTAERSFEIDGRLELLGRANPVTLQARWNKSAESPFGGGLFRSRPYVIGLSIRGSVRRSGFGMTYGVDNGWVGDTVDLLIELEAIRRS